MSKTKLTILLSGMVAGDPHQGGATWAVLQYLLGFRRLGHDVYLVEPMLGDKTLPAATPLRDSINAHYFLEVIRAFGLGDKAALLQEGTPDTVGLGYEQLRGIARRADVLVNISGMLKDPELTQPIATRVYLDLDPAFIQLWQAVQGIDMRFEGHTHFVTVGQAIGRPDCPVPTCGLTWIPTLPPVVLEHWPAAEGIARDAFTTVGNWRGYGSIEHQGIHYGQRAHSLREVFDLPALSGSAFALALAIHPGEVRDLAALKSKGWQLLDPMDVAGTPVRYRQFLQGSRAEFGVAKSGYVASRCGWVSDRSACYLASGRPVLAQETGFSSFLPVGAGLLAWSTLADAVGGIAALQRDYARHARAARALAEEFFDSDRVLARLLERIGRTP